MRPASPFALLASALALSQTHGAKITAATAPPPANKEKWFSIKALATGAELRLRGYIGEASQSRDYWTGEMVETGGMGTLKEFEDALLALGDVPLIDVYLTSEGGDFPTAIAISSILARQKARIVCTIDGFAYSAAPVIACAADEVRCAGNALLMIHDAEFWSAGNDEEALQKAIEVLRACNTSMAAAFINKAGGTADEWMALMKKTHWMTGREAAALKLVDVILDDVALSAYQPLKRVTAAHKPPPQITALIDTIPVSPPASTTPPLMKPTPELITAAAAFGITLTAESDDAAVSAALVKISAAAPKPAAPVVPAAPASPVTLEQITGAITAAVNPLKETITAQGKELQHLKGVKDQGLGGADSPTAASPAPVTGAKKVEEEESTTPRQRSVTALAALPVFSKK